MLEKRCRAFILSYSVGMFEVRNCPLLLASEGRVLFASILRLHASGAYITIFPGGR
jgi:hypothetical protein